MDVPYDIWPVIFQFLHNDFHSLCASLFVCRAFYDAAIPALYGSRIVPSTKLYDTLTAKPSLRGFVREICDSPILIGSEPASSSSAVYYHGLPLLDFSIVPTLVSLCPNITTYILHRSACSGDPDPNTARLLSSLSQSSHLTTFVVFCGSITFDNAQKLSKLSNLRTISLIKSIYSRNTQQTLEYLYSSANTIRDVEIEGYLVYQSEELLLNFFSQASGITYLNLGRSCTPSTLLSILSMVPNLQTLHAYLGPVRESSDSSHVRGTNPRLHYLRDLTIHHDCMLSSTDFEDVEAFERLVTAYSPMERFDFAASQNFAVQLDEYIQDLAWRHGATLKSLGLSPHFLNAEMLVAALSVHPTLLTELSLRVRRDCVEKTAFAVASVSSLEALHMNVDVADDYEINRYLNNVARILKREGNDTMRLSINGRSVQVWRYSPATATITEGNPCLNDVVGSESCPITSKHAIWQDEAEGMPVDQ